MSVKIMALVWDMTELSQAETLVALALADHADESGECWPSIERIAEKARIKRRQTQNVIKSLEARGIIEVDRRIGRSNTSRYQFCLDKGAISAPLCSTTKGASVAPLAGGKGAISDMEKVQPVTEKVQPATGKGATAIAPEPSRTIREPSEEPSGLDREAWERWLEYRGEIRKPIKPVSMPAAQRKLAGFGADQAEVVEQSIAAGWQGLFPLKDKPNGTSRQVGKPSAIERQKAATAAWLDRVSNQS